MPNRPTVASPRGFGRSAWWVLVLWVFVVGQSGDCEQPTGNTDLTLLELEDEGQNVVVGFMSSERTYDVAVAKNPVTVRAESVEAGATISLFYEGAYLPIGIGSGEVDVSVSLGMSALVVVVEATGGLVRSYILNVTHDVPPQTKTIPVPCVSAVPAPKELGFDLTVAAPSVAGGPAPEDFTASFSGVARVPKFYMEVASNIIPGGIQQGVVDDVAATVQVRSGATGPDVLLTADLDAIIPGPTNLCALPPGQVCDPANDLDPNDPLAGNTDCLGGVLPCLPEVTLIDFPTSSDCGAGGVCEAIGEGFANPNSSCSYVGFCFTDDLSIPLAAATGVFTPDSSGDDILFGWADQNVPDLVLCPAAAPRCTETFHPDGSYDLPPAVYANPVAPMGLRLDFSSLFLPLQCAMAEPGGVCTGQTDLGCLTDADCGAFGPCDFTVEGVSMPTPDASLIAVPIEAPNP